MMWLRFLSMLGVGVANHAAKHRRSVEFPMESIDEPRGSIVKRRKSFFMLFVLLLRVPTVALAQGYPVRFALAAVAHSRMASSPAVKIGVVLAEIAEIHCGVHPLGETAMSWLLGRWGKTATPDRTLSNRCACGFR
jgi:hypothetical protein